MTVGQLSQLKKFEKKMDFAIMTRMKKSGPFLFFNSTRQLSKSNNLKCDIGTAVPLDNFWLKNGWFRPDLPKLAHQIVTVLVPLYPMARNKVKMGTLL